MRNSYRKTYRKMRRVQKGIEARKRGFPKAALIFILCAVAAGIIAAIAIPRYVASQRRTVNEVHTDSTVAMGGDTQVPYIEMLMESGAVYNRLSGYASENFSKTDTGYSLTILPEDLRQRVLISEAYDNVESVSYQVRDLSTGDLTEETTVEEIKETSGLTEAVLNIKNLINARREYNLQIRLKIKDRPAILYNTRIESLGDSSAVQGAVTFADEFVRQSVSDGETDFIEGYLTPMSSTESFNYALTDITSPASLVMWKGLSPKSEERPVLSLLSADETEAVITASYPITVDGVGKKRERVVVNDLLTVEFTDEGSEPYLYDFKRKAYESVSAESLDITDATVAFGFQADDTMRSVSSGNGQYICFVNGGNLWRVCSGTGREKTGFIRLFSFEGESRDVCDVTPIISYDENGDIEECESGFGINIISVADNGDVTFAVYGLFPAGVHAGESGISVFEYDNAAGKLAEVLFVKASKNVQEMREFAARSYLNKYGEMFVSSEGEDIRINVNDYSKAVVTGKAVDDKIFYSEDSSVMAYSAKNGAVPGLSDKIDIFDRDEGRLISVEAGDGADLKLFGFIGDDILYGVAGEGDYETTIGGAKPYFNRIVIADRYGDEKKSYNKENEFYSDVYIDGGTAKFSTAKRDGEGFVPGEDAGLVANAVSEDPVFVTVYNSSDERRKELYGYFSRGANDGDEVTILSEYEYNKGNTVEL